MDAGTCLSCRRCKCKKKAHEKSETARRTTYIVNTRKQCSHTSSCDVCARIDGRMSHKRGSCQRSCSRYRSDSSDTSNYKEEKLSGMKSKRSESPYSKSSSLESGYGSDGPFWMNSKFMFRCPLSIVEKTEEQICKENLTSSSLRYIHTSSSRVHKHRYCHHCPIDRKSFHGLHCCHTNNENCSSDSDDSRKGHEFSFCRHRNTSHGPGHVDSHEICHSKQPEDIIYCISSSMGVKEGLTSKTRGFMNGVCVTSEDRNVEGSNVGCFQHTHMPFGREKGSLTITREKNGAIVQCTTGNEKTATMITKQWSHLEMQPSQCNNKQSSIQIHKFSL